VAASDGADLVPDRFCDGYDRSPVERAYHGWLARRVSGEVLHPPSASVVDLAEGLPELRFAAGGVVNGGKRSLARILTGLA